MPRFFRWLGVLAMIVLPGLPRPGQAQEPRLKPPLLPTNDPPVWMIENKLGLVPPDCARYVQIHKMLDRPFMTASLRRHLGLTEAEWDKMCQIIALPTYCENFPAQTLSDVARLDDLADQLDQAPAPEAAYEDLSAKIMTHATRWQWRELNRLLGKQRFGRLRQLLWQQAIRGPASPNITLALLDDPTFVTTLGLSPKQRQRLCQQIEQSNEKFDKLCEGFTSRPENRHRTTEQIEAAFKQEVAKLHSSITSLLTPAQVKKLDSLCGPPLPGSYWPRAGYAGLTGPSPSGRPNFLFYRDLAENQFDLLHR